MPAGGDVPWGAFVLHVPRLVSQYSVSLGRVCPAVYSIGINGSSNAHSLVSASTDGRLCCWEAARVSETQVRATVVSFCSWRLLAVPVVGVLAWRC